MNEVHECFILSFDPIAMCLAVPSRIVEINGAMATVDVHGVRRDVGIMLLPDGVSVGDYVLVHAGFAIQKIDKESGDETLKLINELLKTEEFG